jgi:hypothetical protein
MDKATAKKIATMYLYELNTSEDFSNVILDEYTIERESLFVFFYESSLYLESGDINNKLAGNAPILIDKNTRGVHLTGTENPVEFFIENYERFGSVYPNLRSDL